MLPVPAGKAGSGQFRALVALGEDDPNRQTLELTKALLAMPKVNPIGATVLQFGKAAATSGAVELRWSPEADDYLLTANLTANPVRSDQ